MEPRSQSSILGLFLAIAISVPAHAAEFNEDAWGARPWGLGGAYIGMSGDAYSPMWNPGATAQTIGHDAVIGFRKPIVRSGTPDQNLGSFSAIFNTPNSLGTWGFWGSHMTSVNVRAENTLAVNYARSFFRDEDIDFSLGFNLKYLHQQLETGTNATRADLGADLGLLLSLQERFRIGASVRDVNRPQVGVANDSRLSAVAGAGASFWLDPYTVIALDAADIGGSAQVRGGLERSFFKERFFLRAGGNRDHATGGFSLASPKAIGAVWSLEYAYGHPFKKDEHDPFHTVALRASFGDQSEETSLEAASVEPVVGAAPARQTMIPGMPNKTESAGKASFLLGPEDIVQIEVENHPELNITTPIDPWGFLKLPYVGQLEVKNMTPEKLSKTLEKIYSNFFIEPPTVTVAVKEYNSRVVYVLGAVNAPGKYPLKGNPVTLRDIIILAGLPTERAANWRIFIVRQTPDGPVYKHVNLHKILYRGKLEKNIELESGDIVYVPMGVLDSIVTWVGRIVGPILGYTRDFVGSAF